MPGHTNAALAVVRRAELRRRRAVSSTPAPRSASARCASTRRSPTSSSTTSCGEIAAMTPGPYFHIGGDEVKTLTADQYTDVHRARAGHRAVARQADDRLGRDRADDLLPTTLVQHWRPDGRRRRRSRKGAKVIMSPANRVYLDMKYDAATPIGLNWAGIIEVRRPTTGIRRRSCRRSGVVDPRRRGANLVRDAREHPRRRVHGVPAARRAVAEVAWSPAGSATGKSFAGASARRRRNGQRWA